MACPPPPTPHHNWSLKPNPCIVSPSHSLHHHMRIQAMSPVVPSLPPPKHSLALSHQKASVVSSHDQTQMQQVRVLHMQITAVTPRESILMSIYVCMQQSQSLVTNCKTIRPHRLRTKQFCMQLTKPYVAEMSCNQLVLIGLLCYKLYAYKRT